MGARSIAIVGGGLAGLSLGIALRQRGVPTTVMEAGSYPRHKVCGEFLSGVSRDTLEALGIDDLFGDAPLHRLVIWRLGERSFRRDRLPVAASGLSRFALDARLAARFEEVGGELRLRERRGRERRAAPGWVWAAGRQGERTPWVGLKAHFEGLRLEGDLELRLGGGAYVGASAVEGGRVNVCGLFRERPAGGTSRTSALLDYLRHSGLEAFADRLEQTAMDAASARSVAALAFSRLPPRQARGSLAIGDAFATIPPFTGNGMSLALESAAEALPFVLGYSRGSLSWAEACDLARRALRRRFGPRLRLARALHPWIHRPGGQRLFRSLSRVRLVPFGPLFRALR